MRKEKKKKARKSRIPKKEKTNRQHATICQSSGNKSDVFKYKAKRKKKTLEINYSILYSNLSINNI